MAVYTHLSERALRQHLRPFKLGDFIEARGVSAGAINTIYEVSTTRGKYILRILEDRPPSDSYFEVCLLDYLCHRALPVPIMMDAGKLGRVISISPRQHLSVFQYLPGREIGVFEVRPEHAAQIGTFLSGMHQATRGFRKRRRNRFDPERIADVLERCILGVNEASQVRDLRILANELLRHHFPLDLPQGVIHGDLFVDNARFIRGKLVGVLDFEMAANGPLAYDLAITIVDWGFLKDRFIPERARALVIGYESQRLLEPIERKYLYELCRFAATRFAVTRFLDFEILPRQVCSRRYKDYRHFMSRLKALKDMGGQKFRSLVLRRM
ncbi:MAG: homoserine kinase [Deltaproteobacteria bacterium]|nr:homoserine kinase [Deltaproteobacteria bacterium]